MGHPMYCPVKGCDTDFENEMVWENYDCGGSANSNITIYGDCPKCGFKVASDFVYDERFSNELMEDANEDTHRQAQVPSKTVIDQWMTNEDADINDADDEEEGE